MSNEDGLRLSRPSETGGYSKKIISGGTSAKTGCLSETSEDCSGCRRLHQASRPRTLDTSRFYKQSDWGGEKSQEYEEQQCRRSASASSGCGQTATGRQNRGIWKLAERGFSGRLSSDRLTGGQENEIAENIYDWWISGKSYRQWYAEKFQQMKLDFGEF